MKRKPLTEKQAKILVISAFAIFLAAEIISVLAQDWIVNNPSVNNLLFYNRWLTSIPGGLTTGAAVLLGFGLTRFEGKFSVMAIIIGVFTFTASLITSFYNIFSTRIEYYPGFYAAISSGVLQGLFEIGMAIFAAGIVGLLFRGLYRERVEAIN